MNQPNWQQHRHPASHANRDCHRDNFIVTELSSPTLRNSLSLSYATGCNISFRERPTFNWSAPLDLFKTSSQRKDATTSNLTSTVHSSRTTRTPEDLVSQGTSTTLSSLRVVSSTPKNPSAG